MFKKKTKMQKQSPKFNDFNEPKFYTKKSKIYEVAIVLDGEVQDIIRTEVRLAALLLSNPLFLDITDLDKKPIIGNLYNEETEEFNEAVKDQETEG
jgi:hypothetical protein